MCEGAQNKDVIAFGGKYEKARIVRTIPNQSCTGDYDDTLVDQHGRTYRCGAHVDATGVQNYWLHDDGTLDPAYEVVARQEEPKPTRRRHMKNIPRDRKEWWLR